MTAFHQIAWDRVSTRQYRNEKIPHDVLESILEAALLAPSSFGRTPVEFWVTEDHDLLGRIADCKSIGAPSIRNAAAAIIVCVDSRDTELWIEDGSVASTYILLAAQEHGIGACWNQVRNRMGRHASTSEEIKHLLHIPQRFEVVSMISLGIPLRPVHRHREISWNLVHWADRE